ncbi:MAG TPA: hypothetical protein VFC77_08365 [Myxococcota bacterium]|nr:hypothetical protein [Myxococcota bacterium]
MDAKAIEAVRTEANQGIAAGNARRTDVAAQRFHKALELTAKIEDAHARRDEVAALAGLFENYRVFDLALQAAEDAVELDRELGLKNLMAQDLLSVGNAHLGMDNVAKAEQLYQQALDVFTAEKDFANAASATTNLAAIIANRGDMKRGIVLLKQSLGYLAKEPFEHTEIQTRFALLQGYEITKSDLEDSVENARQICRLLDRMPPDQRAMTKDFVRRTAARYVAAHRELDAAAWKRKNFPAVGA